VTPSSNALSAPSLAALLKSVAAVKKHEPSDSPLRFALPRGAGAAGKLELMPLNEVVRERYTVYYNVSLVN